MADFFGASASIQIVSRPSISGDRAIQVLPMIPGRMTLTTRLFKPRLRVLIPTMKFTVPSLFTIYTRLLTTYSPKQNTQRLYIGCLMMYKHDSTDMHLGFRRFRGIPKPHSSIQLVRLKS